MGICRRFPIKIQYIFLGHNRSYLFVNVDVVDVVDVNRKKTDVRSMSPINPINCFTFDTFLLKICCFAKLDMNRKKRSNAVYLEPWIQVFYSRKKIDCVANSEMKCYNVEQGHSCTIFRSVGQEKMALGLWNDLFFCFKDIFPGISIQAFSVIYFSVVSDVNLLLLTSCKKLDSVFQVCLLRNFFSLNIHIVYTLFFFFWKFA